MPFFLLTVERAYRFGGMLQVLPRVRLADLAERGRDVLVPGQGDILELHLPGGGKRYATIGSFGVEAWRKNGKLVTASDPADPVLTLNLAGDLEPGELPPGTQIWLTEPKAKPAATS